jgi:GT2 family glycosyltransferase
LIDGEDEGTSNWTAEIGWRMPRIEVACYICLRQPRFTQGCKANYYYYYCYYYYYYATNNNNSNNNIKITRPKKTYAFFIIIVKNYPEYYIFLSH